MSRNVTAKPMKGEEVKRIRERHGMTQEDLAKRLGVARLTVIRWENGQSPISKPVALAIRSIDKAERAA